MPELPEVEVTRRGLLPHLRGHIITDVFWSGKHLRKPVPYDQIKQHICGRRLHNIERKAKYLLMRMNNCSTLVVHLGMSGTLGLFPRNARIKKHDHMALSFDTGLEVRFNDARRFGSISIWPPSEAETLENRFTGTLGIEPFSNKYNGNVLRQAAMNKKRPIKTFMMDAKIISGLGNIYVNETLFAAKIHPAVPAGKITPEQWEKIVAVSRKILNKAIDAGGSTISDFHNSDGKPGYFQLQLKIYNRAGSECCRCRGTIEKIIIGGRATYLCRTCQKNYNNT